jgi:hypothetical protein
MNLVHAVTLLSCNLEQSSLLRSNLKYGVSKYLLYIVITMKHSITIHPSLEVYLVL